MAAAVPFAIQGGAALYSQYKNKKNAAAQQTAMQGTQQAAAQVGAAAPPLLQQGQQLTQQGAGQLGQAGDYYGNILSNRRAATNSLAPEMSTALDFYRGAENKTERTMRGGSRDYALAELDRQKVGQLASYLPAARANAAQGMERVGGAALNAGAGASGQGVNAAAMGGYLNNQAFQQGQTQRQNSADSSSAWGKLFSGALTAYLASKGGKGGGGGGGTLPGVRGSVPNLFQGF